MTQVNDIRKKYFEEGKNISQISGEVGFDRKTIRKFIEKDDWNEDPPKLQLQSEFPKLNSFKKVIDEWLTEDKKAKRKQRHTAQRVFDRLTKIYGQEFDCSYRTVAGYVAIKKKEIFGVKQVGCLPLEHIPGEAQVDFGDSDYYENGKLYSGKYLNLSFPYSNKGYFQQFKGENQECLFEGLVSIFDHIGGVPTRIWFDNTSTIVTNILKDGNRDLTQSFLRFKEHYGFECAFCNAASGHEKGNVESKVGYHRRNILVPVPRFTSLLEFNKTLLLECDEDANREHYRKGESIETLFANDKVFLLKLPTTVLDVCKYVKVKTNGYGRFFLNKGLHEYSVAPKYTNTHILVKLTANEVIPLDDSFREIVKHERFYGDSKQQSMKWLPYLTQLSRCPGALKYTGIYQMLPDPVKEYLGKCTRSEKGKALQVIASLTNQNGFESAVESVDKVLTYGATDPDSLIRLHSRLHENVLELDPMKLSNNIPHLARVNSNLTAYDFALGKAGDDYADKSDSGVL